MKQVILIIGLLFSFGAANAQVANTPVGGQPSYQQTAHNQALAMQETLLLSNDQTVKVEALALSRMEAIAAINSDGTKTADVHKKEIQAVNDSKDKELSGILTPNQYALFLQKREELKNRRKTAH